MASSIGFDVWVTRHNRARTRVWRSQLAQLVQGTFLPLFPLRKHPLWSRDPASWPVVSCGSVSARVFFYLFFFPPSVHVDERRRRISPFGKRCSKQPAVFHRRAFRSNLSKPTGRSREFRSHQRGLSFLGKPPVSKAAAGSNYFTRVTKYASPDRRIV